MWSITSQDPYRSNVSNCHFKRKAGNIIKIIEHNLQGLKKPKYFLCFTYYSIL